MSLCLNDGAATVNNAVLCRPCIITLDEAITELPPLYRVLLSMHTGTGSSEKVSGSREPSIPYRDAIGDARADIRDYLAGWARNVADQLGSAPESSEPADTGLYLRLHLGWLASYDAAGDAYAELTACHSTAVALAQPAIQRRFPIVLPDGSPARCDRCSGELRAVMADPDNRAGSVIACRRCGHTIPATAWPALSSTDTYASIADIAAISGLSMATLYSYASRHQWRKIRQQKQLLYSWHDVSATINHAGYLTTGNNAANFPS